MRPLPDDHLAAKIIFEILVALFVLPELRTRIASLRNRSGSRVEMTSFVVVVATIAPGLIVAFVLAERAPSTAIPDGRWALFALGLAAMAAGIALRQWSVFTLGRFFTVDVRVHRDQVVVERGPYRWVRHPSYTGLLVTCVGIGLALGNWISLALAVEPPTVGIVLRIRAEEHALLSGLGEPYRRFAATRARLAPYVW